jgi:IS30 family transposase
MIMAGSLTTLERECVFACLREDPDVSFAEIGRRVGRHGSTISREIGRNDGREGYSPSRADARAREQACRSRPSKLETDVVLAHRVTADLRAGFSPAGVAWRLKSEDGGSVSHETIYRAVFAGVLNVDPTLVLRTRRRCRRRRKADLTTNPSGNFLGEYRPISARPVRVDTRQEAGHWEGDLIVGQAAKSAMITLYERVLRLTHLIALPDGKNADGVAEALGRWLEVLPDWMRRSLTWDQGVEMARWTRVDPLLTDGVYFADKHSPWQRGGNEGNNRLIRFWFPKGTDLSQPGRRLDQAIYVLNNQPRRSLGWLTPNQTYDAHKRALTG